MWAAEALGVGLKEGAKLGLVSLLVVAWARHAVGDGARRVALSWFAAGLAASAAVSAASVLIPITPATRLLLPRITGYVFFLFYASAVAILGFGGGRRDASAGFAAAGRLAGPLVGISTLAFFGPAAVGSSMYLRELSRMREAALSVYAAASVGFAAAPAAVWIVARGRRLAFGRDLGAGQFLLLLALLELLVGGRKGFGSFSLLPAVQEGSITFVHNFVHMVFMVIQVPDHPLVTTSFWNSVNTLFSAHAGEVMAFGIVVAPVAAWAYGRLSAPFEAAALPPGPERRMRIAEARTRRRRETAPAAIFLAAVAGTWIFGADQISSVLHLPDIRPVVAEGGRVRIPLDAPGFHPADGRLHKFAVRLEGGDVVFMVMRRPGGGIATMLDACAMCPPEGYGVSGGHVVCIYCLTPIPAETLGEAGGCNPIPLEARMTPESIEIEVRHLAERRRLVDRGRS